MPKSKRRRSPSSNDKNIFSVFAKKIISGGAISSLLFFLLMLLLALITMKAKVSDTMQNILVFFFAVLSPFVGSFIVFRKESNKGIMLGAFSATASIIIACIVLLCFLHTLGTKTILMSALMLLGGISGGIAAVNKR
ncbi:MAG: TIGR04086 family membrane protein [Ruminococcaceae bacterium]|nr:TIGR04086 family membrane protein [Oscillospiraceae bacterium]